ncbi:hypothetical protein CBM2623_A120074 [Cupriavidus taiwanensis]|nr:hypothetical protein CBM2608_A110052 [Cupriavidus taiwanensis]SPA25552.1 hypothetical protein CBM2623_A120074 [Cupriavidus taiwanensis]
MIRQDWTHSSRTNVERCPHYSLSVCTMPGFTWGRQPHSKFV